MKGKHMNMIYPISGWDKRKLDHDFNYFDVTTRKLSICVSIEVQLKPVWLRSYPGRRIELTAWYPNLRKSAIKLAENLLDNIARWEDLPAIGWKPTAASRQKPAKRVCQK